MKATAFAACTILAAGIFFQGVTAPVPCQAAEAAQKDMSRQDAIIRQAWTDYNIGHYKQAMNALAPLAEGGNDKAQVLVGRMYENGLGVLPDPVTACEWYGKAAGQGNAEAMVLLGYAYKLGAGVPKDGVQAFGWIQKAADSGYADGQFAFAMLLNEGKLVEKNDALAFAWAEKAANQGHAEAMRFVGACYAHGAGVDKDMAKSSEWCDKAAACGLPCEGAVFAKPAQ